MEVCVDSIESVLNACNGGAKRIELCSSLSVGGLTPSIGLFRVARNLTSRDLKIFVMIRPKPDTTYHYNKHELDIMAEEIQAFKENGADGFVFACLDDKGKIDEGSCQKLLTIANPLPCTFHRAFDILKQPEEALKIIINLGFKRILTSGQEENALLGKMLIKKLITTAQLLNSDIIIMPGGGVDPSNVHEILQTTEAKEFHGSAKIKSAPKSNTYSGDTGITTDEASVREMIRIGKKLGVS